MTCGKSKPSVTLFHCHGVLQNANFVIDCKASISEALMHSAESNPMLKVTYLCYALKCCNYGGITCCSNTEDITQVCVTQLILCCYTDHNAKKYLRCSINQSCTGGSDAVYFLFCNRSAVASQMFLLHPMTHTISQHMIVLFLRLLHPCSAPCIAVADLQTYICIAA